MGKARSEQKSESKSNKLIMMKRSMEVWKSTTYTLIYYSTINLRSMNNFTFALSWKLSH